MERESASIAEHPPHSPAADDLANALLIAAF
jgi:hypothetical protein